MSRNTNRIGKEERIRRITELIGDGLFTYQIVDICTKEWGVGRRQVENYLTLVYKFLKTNLTEKDKDMILLEYSRLIQKHEKSNPKLAFEYRKHRDKIIGLGVDRVDVTSNGKDVGTTIINIIKPNERD